MCTSSVVNNHFRHLFVYLQAANEGLHVEPLCKMLSMVHLNLNIRTSGTALKHTHNPSVKDSFTITVLAMLDGYIGLTEILKLAMRVEKSGRSHQMSSLIFQKYKHQYLSLSIWFKKRKKRKTWFHYILTNHLPCCCVIMHDNQISHI